MVDRAGKLDLRGSSHAHSLARVSPTANRKQGLSPRSLREAPSDPAKRTRKAETGLDLAKRLDPAKRLTPRSAPAGLILLSGQGDSRSEASDAPVAPRFFPIGPVEPIPREVIDQPGTRRLRVWLEPDPDRGWTDPDIRSIWPGTIETGWVNLEIVRR